MYKFRNHLKQIVFAAALILCLTSAATKAEAIFRCPNGNLVDTGDSIVVVTAKCDPPASVSKTQEPFTTSDGKVGYIEVQEWLYTAGSSLMHILVFRNGTLVSITTGGHVK